jgi:hypothetical protein
LDRFSQRGSPLFTFILGKRYAIKFARFKPGSKLILRLFNKLENGFSLINPTRLGAFQGCTIFLTDEAVFYLKGERFQRIKGCLALLTPVRQPDGFLHFSEIREVEIYTTLITP